MTDEEKAEARATDPRAAAIIDRCDGCRPRSCSSCTASCATRADAGLGARTPRPAAGDGRPAVVGPRRPTPRSARDRTPSSSTGSRVAPGQPRPAPPARRADAQDLFFAGQVGRVTAVLCDVDGETHVAVVLVDDPAADLHELVRPLPLLRARRARAGRRDRDERATTRGECDHESTSASATTVVARAVLVVAAVVIVRSAPDVKRYLKMRNM